MPNDFAGALSESAARFDAIVKPELLGVLGGDFRTVEGVTIDEMAKLLDTLAGIDVWHIDSLRGIRGLASRIQTTSRDWHTFTIRKSRASGAKTEYEKRKLAIENGYLYPYFTMQAYISEGDQRLISFAVAKTADIIEMIDEGHCRENHTGHAQIGQAGFYVVDWYEMKSLQYPIRIRNK